MRKNNHKENTHHTALLDCIRTRIEQRGPLPFREFMDIALYQPGLGYYSAGNIKIGADGDFVTAPEMSPFFGAALAHQFAAYMQQLDDPCILELGAGTGVFAAQCLQTLEALDALPQRYAILEVSADFRAVQQQRLEQLPAHLQRRVEWLDQPPQTPWQGVVFGNEVLDALPVEVFRNHRGALQQLCIGLDEAGALCEIWRPMPARLLQHLSDAGRQLPEGHRAEFLPQLQPWLAHVTEHLTRGQVLFIDYGYCDAEWHHPQRREGTLVCHHRHRANFEPLQRIGRQDITAFVNFSTLAEAGTALGLTPGGYTAQAQFLIDLGIDRLIPNDLDPSEYLDLIGGLKRLILPTEMGEKFKVMSLLKGEEIAPAGFENNLGRLL